MCGIFAYTGPRDDAPALVIEGLKSLEYRGYDSWGVAVKSGAPPALVITKCVGKISSLVDASALGRGHVAMGHSRWATHGAVTEGNAHPHYACDDRVAVIHNGIVENHRELRIELEARGHRFHSQTDTEVIAHLVEQNLCEGAGLAEAVRHTFLRLQGRNALIVMARDTDELVAVRNGSPLVLGPIVQDGTFACVLASDTPAMLPHTRDVIFLGDGELAHLDGDLRLYDTHLGAPIERRPERVTWEAAQAEKGPYPHFMLKEIMEQREALGRALNQPAELVQTVARAMRVAENLFFAGCGTAGKVAQMGTYLFADVAGRPSSFILGSEFKNYRHSLHERTLLVAISQSGETADLLEAVEVAGARGSTVIAVVNVPGSTLTRLADHTLLDNAGPEKAVCSTKATLGQIAIVTLLAYACAGLAADGFELVTHAAATIERTLVPESLERIRDLARRFKDAHDLYIIGRGLSYPVALEAAVKIQEVSYIHAEGLAGGELKHYAIALIEPGTPCIALVPDDETRHEILSNATEVKARGGTIIGIAPETHPIFDVHLPVSDAGMASAIVNLVPVQILAYYLAVERGCDPDMPRNLAKSVTVK